MHFGDFELGDIDGVSPVSLLTNPDDRGYLCELFRGDIYGLTYPAMGYVSQTKQNIVRGPHEHVQQSDMFVFCFSVFDVYLWDARPQSPTYGRCTRLHLDNNGSDYWRLVVPPGVVHAYVALGENGIVLNFPDQLYRGTNYRDPVDEIRHECDPNSPFKIW